MQFITEDIILQFKQYLIDEEKSEATISKYLRDIKAFAVWLSGRMPDKSIVLAYKEQLLSQYNAVSVNSVISSLNSFFSFADLHKLRIKTVKVQKQIFMKRERELSKAEYRKLLEAAEKQGNERLGLMMQTICATGIRVSELEFITVEAVKSETAQIRCKGKVRYVFLPKQLCRLLMKYVKRRGLTHGSVFVTKSGRPIDRSNIWSDMKRLCEEAGVARQKVFPHNLRHLFARVYYSMQKDVVRLADILGHQSVNTTRIYTMETGEIHRKQIQSLGLLMGIKNTT